MSPEYRDTIDLSRAEPIVERTKHSIVMVNIIGIVFLLVLIASGIFFFHNYASKSKAETQAAFDMHEITQARLSKNQTEAFTQVTTTPIPPKKEVIGFVPYWSVGNKSLVRTEKMTQIIYFGLNVNEKGQILTKNEEGKYLNEWLQFKSDYFNEIRQRSKKTDTKILVALKNFEGVRINQLISNPAAVNTFIQQTSKLITDEHLDGVNIDFEYFTYSDFPTMRYLNPFLEKFVKEIKKDHPQAIISFDVNATVVFQDNAYDMVKIGESVDQVILMAYDYHRAGSTTAGPIAPLDNEDHKHSVSRSLESMYGRVPDEKIILAIPFYGFEWQTESTNYKSKTIPETGAGATYERVRTLLDNRKDIKVNWDEKAQSPWIVYQHNGLIKQIYYEDEQSMQKKVELIQANQLGGAAIWAVGFEGDYEEPWDVLDLLNKTR